MLARQMIERVPEEVRMAALLGRFGDHLTDRCDQAASSVGHDQFDDLESASPAHKAAFTGLTRGML